MKLKEVFKRTWTDFNKDKHGLINAIRTFKNSFNRYRRSKLLMKIRTSKYGLEDDDTRKIIEAYFQIKSIQRQRGHNLLIIVLTFLLIYVTWIKN